MELNRFQAGYRGSKFSSDLILFLFPFGAWVTLKSKKPFYILTNLEIINLFRYSEEKSKVIHHIIKPSPIKVGNFENLNFDQFTKKLELHLKDIVKLAFDKKIPEWKFGLSDLERSLENNYKKKKKWDEIISESLSGYIAGSILEKKDITRNEKLINQLLDKNGFTSIRKKINYKKDYKLKDVKLWLGY